MRRIYFDHGGTTKPRAEVVKAMKPFFSEKFGNPSSLHSFGREAAEALEHSRNVFAKLLGCSADEIYFTSGGSESNNLAIKGLAFAREKKHIITTPIEHHCIVDAVGWLKERGYKITELPVDKYGLVDPRDVEKAITGDTLLVSVMFANNEVGTVEPIEEIARICTKHNVPFHTDAVQAFTKVPIDVRKLGVDMLSLSAHKIYGPKGVGLLYVRKGISLEPLMHGGGQERGLRSGTENVPGIVGFARAAELACKEMRPEMKRQARLRDKLIAGMLKVPNTWLNGHPAKRLPNNVNVGFAFIEGESLILHLDGKGIAASTGSACSSKSLEPSHVLLAMGQKHEEAHGSLRVTIGRETTGAEVKYFLNELPKIVSKLRQISPFKREYG